MHATASHREQNFVTEACIIGREKSEKEMWHAWRDYLHKSVTQDLIPVDRHGEHFLLQPSAILLLKFIAQLDVLSHDAKVAIVHRLVLQVEYLAGVSARVESIHACPQRTLLRLKVPRTGVHVWK